MKRYTDGTDIPGTENDPDEDTTEENPNATVVENSEIPAFVLEMSRANQAARESQAETARLRAEIDALRNPPAPLVKLEEGDAFNKPNKLLDAFSAMLDAQVGPIKKDLAETQRARAYADLKSQIKAANPAFAKIESIVDQLMVGKEPTESNIVEAVERAVGRLTLTNPSALQSRPNSEEPTNKVQPPPHLSSKPKPKAPDNRADPKYDIANFNENEKRLMREKGLTPKQFVTLRDTDPNSLTPARYKQIMEDKS